MTLPNEAAACADLTDGGAAERRRRSAPADAPACMVVTATLVATLTGANNLMSLSFDSLGNMFGTAYNSAGSFYPR